MGDKYKRASVGDPISGIPADTYNDLLDLLKRSDHRKTAPQAEINTLVGVEILIKNVSGGDLLDKAIVGIGPRLVGPYKNDEYFFGRSVRESADPGATDPFAILLRSADENAIVPAWFPNGMYARVDLQDTSHTFASPIDADYVKLLSDASTGSMQIVDAEIPSNMQLDGGINNSVTTMTVDANTDWPDPPYVVQIDTEQILVGARSGTDNVTQSSLTRGYNGTSAASHSDNAAVSFVSGTVWSLVMTAGGAANIIGPQLRITDGINHGNTYACTLLDIDPNTDARSTGIRIWGDDLSNSPILHPDSDYLCHSLGNSGPGGPFIVAIASTTGDALTNTAKWVTLLSDPTSPLAFVLDIVSTGTPIANGTQTLNANSSPTDFDSLITVSIVDGDSSISAGLVTLEGTDGDGNAASEVINIAGGGTHAYTSVKSYREIRSVVLSGIIGATGSDLMGVWIKVYPFGVLRTYSGSTYLVKNTAGDNSHASNPGADADWMTITLSDQGTYDSGTAYNAGDYVQESLPKYDFNSMPSGVYSPICSPGSNVDSLLPHGFRWSKQGNIVTVAGLIGVTVTATNTETDFTITLPVSSSYDRFGQLGGSGADELASAWYIDGYNNTHLEAYFQSVPNTSVGGESVNVGFTLMYEIT